MKNAHHLRVLRGKQLGVFDKDREAVLSSLSMSPRETATHLALTVLGSLLSREAGTSTAPHLQPVPN